MHVVLHDVTYIYIHVVWRGDSYQPMVLSMQWSVAKVSHPDKWNHLWLPKRKANPLDY